MKKFDPSITEESLYRGCIPHRIYQILKQNGHPMTLDEIYFALKRTYFGFGRLYVRRILQEKRHFISEEGSDTWRLAIWDK